MRALFLIMKIPNISPILNSVQKEESAKLLSQLISAAHRLMQPYVEPTLKVLLPKAKDTNPGVSSKVLVAIGELSLVGGEGMLPYLDDILPIIIDTLQDQSSETKREAALKTLGQVCCLAFIFFFFV